MLNSFRLVDFGDTDRFSQTDTDEILELIEGELLNEFIPESAGFRNRISLGILHEVD